MIGHYHDLFDVITKATVINQAVLAILIGISVVSWANILSKSLAYLMIVLRRAKYR